ncbi:fused response regulator/phosphatase [Chitinimonas sp. BJYL2]|uniref:ATP-binding SpoIIE family protein phosphatase n=1 Tax=Chitinimonas sp. BJYL2 TaxID=2976696 RepID=UPI0022B4FE1D|nr:fused response regulator/phosphatase [Chitinimonas sp. BJYL2]
MKILLADDAEVVRLVVGRFVESMGHELVLALDGIDAVASYRQHRPDMVLMDMLMPRLDGPQAGRQIKEIAGEHWVPIVLITAVEEVAQLADAMELGVDDYLIKPVNFRILEAKIRAIERTLELNRKVRDQALKLADYYDKAEEEKLVARHLMEQLVNRERLSDTQLHAWIAPAESLSGDLIAAARTPGRVLHLMLADGIGHGLTAALNVLPLTQPFYAMTARGFDIEDILVEMHSKVREVLPLGRFVALAVVTVDFARRTIGVWNGGIPALRLLDENGDERMAWPSHNLPLGILANTEFVPEIERYAFASRCSLVACSDGLLEARNPAGEAFGEARLLAACAGKSAVSARQDIIDALARFVGDAERHDDISLVLIDIDPAAVTPSPSPARWPDVPMQMESAEWQYELSLGADELRHLRTVPHILGFVSQIDSLVKVQADLFVILNELVTNAVDHGLLGLPPSVRSEPEGMIRYRRARIRRLQGLKSGRVDIRLRASKCADEVIVRVRVADTGPGFDWQRWQSGHLPPAEASRGLMVVRGLVRDLVFEGVGNAVEATYVARVQ